MPCQFAPDAIHSRILPITKSDAYLVVHRGVRWTDVIRLSPAMNARIGRASDCQIVLRSARASRHHAVVRPAGPDDPDTWVIEDLNSRNGVTVNGDPIKQPRRLDPGDRVVIVGFEILFTHDLTQVASQVARPVAKWVPTAEIDEQVTQEDLGRVWEDDVVEPDVVSRRPATGWLESVRPADAVGGHHMTGPLTDADRRLVRLAFELGRCGTPDEAADRLVQTIRTQTPTASIGFYWFDESTPLPPPIRIDQPASRRYRRPPESLVRQILLPDAPALLARNVVGDDQLATENSRGEIDVESIVLVPLRRINGPAVGLLHLTTAEGDQALDDDDLAWVAAAGEVFVESNSIVQQRDQLTRSLKRSQRTIARLRQQLAGRVVLIGRSEPIQRLAQAITQVAPTGAGVLVRGPSGSGKELVAAAIHYASPRCDGPMICLNCAALSKDLLESELFGHERGAFTGATDMKRGKFESASGGTLMLDEIGEMSLDLQAKLLRVLEGHPFERVGGHQPIRVDVRVIAATHRDLQAMVAAGTFREDLYYRLHVVELLVPPLRDRGQDVTLLADHFLNQFATSMGRGSLTLTDAAQQKLLAHDWPGNVRELRNVIERAVVMAPLGQPATAIDADDLLLSATKRRRLGATDADNDSTQLPTLSQLETQHIARVLRATGGNKSRAATILGIERSTLDRKLKRAGS